MQYFATHYWQPGEDNTVSLVLQQAYHKRKKLPVLFACIYRGGQVENKFPEKMIDWFYGDGLGLCSQRGEREMEVIERAFISYTKKTLQEELHRNPETEVSGILLAGRCFVMFQKGQQGIKLINTKHRRPYCRTMIMDGASCKLCFQTGVVERGVGILLTTDTFDKKITRSMVEECLNIKELRTQEQADRHLQELGDAAGSRDTESLGAVLIVSKEEK